MTFCMDELKEIYDGFSFFTSDRDCIEYLLHENLQPLEEYALLITGKKAWIITPHELESALADSIVYEGYSNRSYQDKRQNIMKILEEFTLPGNMETAFERLEYADYFRNRGMEVTDESLKMTKASLIKNREQISRIEECVAINEKAYRAMMGRDICGKTELSLFTCVEESVMEHTSFANPMIYDFLAGVRTAQVSGFPTNYKVRKQETLIADLLPRHKGVYADMTRTFFAGSPSDKQRAAYEILEEALLHAEKMLMPGIRAREVYERVYEVFRKYRVEQNFPHHAGHGLGMGYYEAPFFLKEEEEMLQKNMVVALEPGLYFENEFGMRIENNYLITPSGAIRLGNLTTDIKSFILGS